jgi:hypothetical protein
MVRMERLRKIMVFQGFDEDQLLILQPYCEELEFQDGHKLFTEGDPAEHLWVVLEGSVDLRFELPHNRPTSKAHSVSMVKVDKSKQEAQIFGWSCFVPPYRMRLSAYCVANGTNIVRVAKKYLIREFEKSPPMGYVFLTHLITVVGYRFHQFQDEVARSIGPSILASW